MVTERVDAPIARVWQFVGDFASLMQWHPDVVSCQVRRVGVGMVRSTHFADWWLAERLDRRDERRHLVAYTVVGSDRPRVIGTRGGIRLIPDGPAGTIVRWTAVLPDGVAARAMTEQLTGYYRRRISQLGAALHRGPPGSGPAAGQGGARCETLPAEPLQH